MQVCRCHLRDPMPPQVAEEAKTTADFPDRTDEVGLPVRMGRTVGVATYRGDMPRSALPTDDRLLAELIAEHTPDGVARMFNVTSEEVSLAVRARAIVVPAPRSPDATGYVGPGPRGTASYTRAARAARRAVEALVQAAVAEASAVEAVFGPDSIQHTQAVDHLRLVLQAEAATKRALADWRPITPQQTLVAARRSDGRFTVTDENGCVLDLGYVADDLDLLPNAADTALARNGFVRIEDWIRGKARVRRL